MWAVCFQECTRLLRSVKSLITVAVIVGISYWVSDLVNQVADIFSEKELAHGHALGVFVLVMLFGPLFVFGLSHDIMNRELSSRTIRFLLTRTSRASIVLGKWFGVLLFWTCCMLVTFGVLFASVRTFDANTLWQCMTLLVYSTSLALLMSIAVPRPSYTMFAGIVLGLGLPFLGLWTLVSSHATAKWIGYLTPYFYIEKGGAFTGVIWLYALLFLSASVYLFQRRDC
ncbi:MULTISPECIES: ABC transporter permease subunit [Brevibacillus]|jgi:ABC-2 type transport system permease protein|uniref:ABC transporter permease n=1 Tax=Brevibacillus aydinogluensis TaxID=927786 RepID=A0AA48MA16_9BACL|nr:MULTISPECIES: ABC transporter permease subunit [Brevibacillus]MBR8660005.1 ABC transporter permease subunit [Brevibacillus sp. NL20B1]CAJ1004039.1 ABC transporter permease [Brevibacillus aydinogluensis]